MTQNNDLQKQISELTAKYQWTEAAKNLFPTLEILPVLSDNTKRLHIKCKSIHEFKTVIETLPPTNKTTLIKFASASDKELNTPFRIDIDNPCQLSNYSRFEINISYTSNDIEVRPSLPIDLVEKWVSRSSRNITDSEYHYFTGVSYAELRRMKVTCYTFKTEQISWYGGNKTLTDENTVNTIIESLLTNEK